MNSAGLAGVLLIPLLSAALLAALPDYHLTARLNVAAALLTFVTAVMFFFVEASPGPYLLVDDLNKVFIVLTTFVAFTTSVFSASYISHEMKTGHLTPISARFYHAMYQLLMFAMNLALLANNIGLMWVAIELATLTTVLMVGIYRTHEALEAAWKYFILGSVGIALALFGTILIYMAAQPVVGEGANAMVWTVLVQHAANFDPALLNLAFVFLLLGYGTKVGLAASRLAARCAFGRSDADFSGALRPSPERRAVRVAAVQDVVGGQSFGNCARPAHGDLGPDLLPIRRLHAVPASRHQTYVCLFFNRAHGYHRVCLRDGRTPREFRRFVAHDYAFADEVGDIFCSWSHRAS
jgi:Proton-conducting membrane transporter